MQHFHIVVAISSPLPQDQRGKQSTREIEQQIPEDALLAHFVKRRKVKKKWLKNFWVIIFYNTMSCMVFSLFNEWMVYWMGVSDIDWMNGLMNVLFNYWMNEYFNEWFNESFFQLLNEWICTHFLFASRCIGFGELRVMRGGEGP